MSAVTEIPQTPALEILRLLVADESGHPDPALVGQLIALGDAAVDTLLAVLRPEAQGEDIEEMRYWAATTLCDIGDPRAAKPVIAFFFDPEPIREDLDEIAAIAWQLGSGIFEPLIAVLEDDTRDYYAHEMAFEAIFFLLKDAPRRWLRVAEPIRARLVQYLQRARDSEKGTPDEQDVTLITSCISLLADLGDQSVLSLVREAYQRNLVDYFMLNQVETEKSLRGKAERYRPMRKRFVRLYEKNYRMFFETEEEQEQRFASMMGRNAPCPCGSGKKYKRGQDG